MFNKNIHKKIGIVSKGAIALASGSAMASVDSSLRGIQGTLINDILPIMGGVGLALAALSFVLGREGAKNHVILAIIGAVVGFAAPSIISFIQGIIH